MTYNWVIFNKKTMEKVGEVSTNHSISLDEAIELLDADRLEVVNIDDPDIMIDGKEYWSEDLDICLFSDFYRCTESDYEYVGKWQDTDIDVVEIDGIRYALYGNNGEKYLHCWKCIDRFTADPDDQEYEITPVYDWEKWNEDDCEFQDADGNAIDGIIGYEVC